MAQAKALPHSPVIDKPVAGPLSLKIGRISLFALTITASSFVFGSLVPFSTLAGVFSQVNLALVVGIGVVFCLLLSLTYAFMGAWIRRDGAEYLLSSRVINPALGFGFSLAMVGAASLGIGFVVAKSGQIVLALWMRSLAAAYSSTSLLQTANSITTPEGVSIIGSVGVALAFLLSIFPARFNRRFIYFGFILLVVSWFVLIFMFTVPAIEFGASWDQVMGQGAHAAVISEAAALAAPSGGNSALLLGGALAAAWVFIGFRLPVSMAGEVKKPGQAFFSNSLMAVLLPGAVLVALTLLLQMRVSPEWLAAQSNLYQSGQEAWPWLPLYAFIVRPDPILISFVCVAWLISLINTAQVFLHATSKMMKTWIADGMFTPVLGYTHPSLKTPLVALMFVAMLAEVGSLVVALSGENPIGGYAFLFAIVFAQILPVLAATLTPFVRKSFLEGSGKLAGLRIGRFPVVTLTGGLSLVILFAVLAAGLSVPQLSAPTLAGVALVAAWVVFGMLWFAHRKRANPEIKKAFETLPEIEE